MGINGYVLSTFETVYYLIQNISGQELMKGKLALNNRN